MSSRVRHREVTNADGDGDNVTITPDPARAALATAIANYEMLAVTLKDLETRLAKAQDVLFAARRTLESAEAKTAAAEDEDALSLVAGEEGNAVSAHRRVLEMLQDRVAAAAKARTLLSQRRDQLTLELSFAKAKRDEVLATLVKGSAETRRLIAMFRRAQRDFHEARGALVVIATAQALPKDADDFVVINWAENLPPSSEAKRFVSWLKQLEADAEAELE